MGERITGEIVNSVQPLIAPLPRIKKKTRKRNGCEVFDECEIRTYKESKPARSALTTHFTLSSINPICARKACARARYSHFSVVFRSSWSRWIRIQYQLVSRIGGNAVSDRHIRRLRAELHKQKKRAWPRSPRSYKAGGIRSKESNRPQTRNTILCGMHLSRKEIGKHSNCLLIRHRIFTVL